MDWDERVFDCMDFSGISEKDDPHCIFYELRLKRDITAENRLFLLNRFY